MIRGSVTFILEPAVESLVRKPGGVGTLISFVVDTGYTGTLTLRPDLIRLLDLKAVGGGTATLADGSRIRHGIYEVEEDWDGHARLVLADEADTDPVIGSLMMADHSLVAELTYGGNVSIEPL